MNREEKRATRLRGAMTLSLSFYLGMGALAVFLIAFFLMLPPIRPVTDQHANRVPAAKLPAEVLTAKGSNLYHGGSKCPYAHKDSKMIATSKAEQEGLVPCPFCIGNSSARLTPMVIARHKAQ